MTTTILKSLKRFPNKDLVRIKNRVEVLAENLPDPKTTKMKGNTPFHKVRSGNYRILYEVHDKRLVILIIKIGHRKDVHRNLS